ncbi:MAG: hypothetical protein ACSHWQ_08110 [Spongiibacteraceae bacterium]
MSIILSRASKLNFVTGLICLALVTGVYLWQTPGLVAGKLSATEIDNYLAKAERQLIMPPKTKALMLSTLRDWAESDDGRPFYMLNLMRYRDSLQKYPGAPNFDGTPQQANAYYESLAIPLVLKHGAYPDSAGNIQAKNLITPSAAMDNWSRAGMVRYRSRRSFFDLLTDPNYAPLEPYKLMAQEILLVPVANDIAIPDPRWLAAGISLSLFLSVAWIGSARRQRALR